MISELNPNGVEHWINQQMVNAIEDAFKKTLNCDEVYYYWVECSDRPNPCMHSDHRIAWFGRGLIPFLKKMQHRAPKPFVIMATSSKNKSGIVDDGWGFDKKTKEWVELYPFKSYKEPPYSNTYWIGDVKGNGSMICGDRLLCALVERIKEKKTKQIKKTWGKGYYNP